MFSCRNEAMSFQSIMSSSQLFCLCMVFWQRGRPEWVTFWKAQERLPVGQGGAGVRWRPALCSLYLDEPGVVQPVPQLQDLLLDHRRLVHLVPQDFVELHTATRRSVAAQAAFFGVVSVTRCVIHSLPCW